VARAPDRTDRNTQRHLFHPRVERRIWLGRIVARSVWNEEHVGKRMGCNRRQDQRMPAGDELRYRSRSGCFHLAGAGELKVPGYKRGIIAGQSWGSWAAMVADQEKDFAVLWLIVPTSGPRRGANGSPKSISTRSGPPTLVIDQPRGFIGHFSGRGWTATSAPLSMDEGIRCQTAAASIFSPARDRSPNPKFTDDRSLRASFDQP